MDAFLQAFPVKRLPHETIECRRLLAAVLLCAIEDYLSFLREAEVYFERDRHTWLCDALDMDAQDVKIKLSKIRDAQKRSKKKRK